MQEWNHYLKLSRYIVLFLIVLYSGCGSATSESTPSNKLISSDNFKSQAPHNQASTESVSLPELKIPHDSSLKVRVLLSQPEQLVIFSNKSFVLATGKPTKNLTAQGATRYPITLKDKDKLQFGKLGTINLPARLITQDPADYFEIGNHRYCGDLLLIQKNQGLLVINELPVEHYVASVVDSEMPTDFGLEARKAQAIIARTYALAHIQLHRPYQPYDLTDTVRHQKYHGLAYQNHEQRWLSATTQNALELTGKTAHMVCTHQKKLFVTYYCACCGGHTFDSSQIFNAQTPEFQGVHDPWCQASPSSTWTIKIPREQAAKFIFDFLNELPAQKDKNIRLANLSGMSRVQPTLPDKLPIWTVRDGKTTVNITANDLKKAWAIFQLPSPNFKIQITSTEFLVEGHGAGHCVGVCQWGSKGMSQAGKSAEEIIRYYYQQVQITDWRTLQLNFPK